MENIICAYACPSTDFNPEPFTPPSFPNEMKVDDAQKNIEYFKQEFKKLFAELESLHGRCSSVRISHTDTKDTFFDDVETEITF